MSCPAGNLAPAASKTCTATYTVTQADIDAGSVTNTATGTGTPPSGPPVSDPDTATVTATASPAIQVVKTASPSSAATAGTVVTYSFVVTNTGNVTLSSVGVTDPLPGLSAVTCPASTLTPAASTTCTATYTVTQADIDSGSVTNTATATGDPPSGPPVTDPDTFVLLAGPLPALDITKVLDPASPTSYSAVGQQLTYDLVATNTGNVTLTGVSVTDPNADPGSIVCVPAAPVTLAPGASTTCAATHTVTQADLDAGSVTNTATATGDPPSGPPITIDSPPVVVPAAPAPQISIVKSTTAAGINRVGQVVPFFFRVTNTGNITLLDISVSDPKTTTPTCPVTTLAPGESTTCTAEHTVTATDLTAGRYENTATVSSSSTDGPLPALESNTIVLVAPPAPPLPRTGADVGRDLRLALELLVVGGLLVGATRRRRADEPGR